MSRIFFLHYAITKTQTCSTLKLQFVVRSMSRINKTILI